MKIEQQAVEFAPIIITLETRENVRVLWDLISSSVPVTPEQESTRIRLCDWFGQNAKL